VSEKRFVEQIRESARRLDKDAFIWKTNDRFSIGIPDLWIVTRGRLFAIEAKSVSSWNPLSDKPLLSHKFSGPQISILRQIRRAGGLSFGAIQTEPSVARILDPFDIPESGNFTAKELERISLRTVKEDGVWRIVDWELYVSMSAVRRANGKCD
jgi:hypothetical protein